MTWGYRRNRCMENNREFGTREELVEYLERMDSATLTHLRYWYIEERFDPTDVLRDLVDGVYKDMTPEMWVDDALDCVESDFTDGGYDWKEDCIERIYYKDDEE